MFTIKDLMVTVLPDAAPDALRGKETDCGSFITCAFTFCTMSVKKQCTAGGAGLEELALLKTALLAEQERVQRIEQGLSDHAKRQVEDMTERLVSAAHDIHTLRQQVENIGIAGENE